MPLARNLAQKVSGVFREGLGVLRGPGLWNMAIIDANSPFTLILLGNQ